MGANVTLFAAPEHTKGLFGERAARGTKWHAGASVWDGASTISRFGRDVYGQLCESAKGAKALAESVFTEESGK
jgi:hypothetical protein